MIRSDRLLARLLLAGAVVLAAPLAVSEVSPAHAQSWTQGSAGSRVSGAGDAAGNGETVTVPREQIARMQARLLELERLVSELTGQVEEAQFAIRTNGRLVRSSASDHTLRLRQIEDKLGLEPPVSTSTDDGGLFGPGIAEPGTEAPAQAGSAGRAGTALVPTQQQNTSSLPPGTYRPGEGTQGTGLGVLRVDDQGQPLAGGNLAQARSQSGISATDMAPLSQPAPLPEPTVDPGQVAAVGDGRPVARAALDRPGGGASTPLLLPEGPAKTQYDYAFDTLRQQNFSGAQSLFEQFLAANPDDPLAANASYWLGETHYVREDFEQAALTFWKTYQSYPKSPKAADALFKFSQSVANIGKNNEACVALGRLVSDYPTAAEYVLQRARTMRQKLGCK